ncbi:MAG: bifunctional hydroxymethylpyrimidine kinase/phosphomethylpyrimidine kinase [Gemmatimonadales bacterium]|nr:bifunctional hydroxymethylpyrimidine kinase/phosphomethylpyrimidine kinase [Gemmatimonadales bacterium]
MLPIALTIAGSDSGGGAGIQADLKTFHQYGVYGTTAIVALTAQNTRGVTAVHPVPAEMVDAQLLALADDLPPDAVKTGMLATAPLVRQVAGALERFGWRRYVLDPVMVASSGDRLLDRDAEAEILARLVPRALLVTPNLDEATILAGQPVTDPASMIAAGRVLLAHGAGAVLIKGGHLPGDTLVDVLVAEAGIFQFEHPKLATTSTHGTGCTLSAALTAGLARWGFGRAAPAAPEFSELVAIVQDALDFLQRAIAAAPSLGSGHGPVDHWTVPGSLGRPR